MNTLAGMPFNQNMYFFWRRHGSPAHEAIRLARADYWGGSRVTVGWVYDDEPFTYECNCKSPENNHRASDVPEKTEWYKIANKGHVVYKTGAVVQMYLMDEDGHPTLYDSLGGIAVSEISTGIGFHYWHATMISEHMPDVVTDYVRNILGVYA